MFCKSCGKEIHDEAVMCVHCGKMTGRPLTTGGENEPDDSPATGGMCFLCFLIPLVGFILYGTNAKSRPRAAKSYLKWAIISMVASAIVLGIYYGIVLSMFM